jgi:hypothetical protein
VSWRACKSNWRTIFETGAAQAASRNGLSLDAYLEMLIALESGSGRTARDGRKLRMRSFIYRDGEHYFVPQGASGT